MTSLQGFLPMLASTSELHHFSGSGPGGDFSDAPAS